VVKLRTDIFLEALRQTGLVQADRFEAVLAELRKTPQVLADAESLARRLIHTGLLAPQDAQKLLEKCRRGVFLGKYRLLKRLDKDSTSSVYLAEHTLMQRRVGIKVLSKSLSTSNAFLNQFIRQARAAATLEHRNIVRTYDVDNAGDIHYLVMEYVEGRDIQRLVEASGLLDFLTAADFLRQAAEGLAYAHRHGLFHRDLKPSNLLITPRKVVKLLGFGLARVEVEEALRARQPAASESLERDLDIFGLGCTFYFMLTGAPAFGAGTLWEHFSARHEHPPKDMRSLRPDVPATLDEVCRNMLGVRAGERFPAAEEIAESLRRWLLEQGFVFSPDESGRLPPESPKQSKPLPPPLPHNVVPSSQPPPLEEKTAASDVVLFSSEADLLSELSSGEQGSAAKGTDFVFDLDSMPLEKPEEVLSPIKDGLLPGRRSAPWWLWLVIALGALAAAVLVVVALWKGA